MAKEVIIKKMNGRLEPFDPSKVRESITRTGASDAVADEILETVRNALKPKMSTKAIYKIVREELNKQKPWAAARYGLREALVKMGPAGFNFEKYVASILTGYGYKTEVPDTFQGACITHETDVTAEKSGRTAFIEAKFRHDFDTAINIKDTMATWARFLDLVDGSNIGLCPHFDEAWIVTNARFTKQSLQYGHCKNMVLIGWNHPRERTFAKMVDLEALYPITMIESLTNDELEAFAEQEIMLCRELCDADAADMAERTDIPKKRIEDLSELCTGVVYGDDRPGASRG